MTLDITNIQAFSIHDGPGVRTTIFLAGCPLRCVWCHNPETQSGKATISFDKTKCLLCRRCEACKQTAHVFSPHHEIAREKCTLCGDCINNCPNEALSFTQSVLSEEEYIKIAERQKRIVGNNGGISFSGGEPLFQGYRFLHFLTLCDIHKAVETCGFASEDIFCKMLEKANFIMFDIKLADLELHKKYTGVSNKLILKNLDNLRQSKRKFILRTPLIPNITDTDENLAAIREIVKDDAWETLPYNPLTKSKYERIGKPFIL